MAPIVSVSHGPNINALCVSIALGWPPPPPGMTRLWKNREAEWPKWVEHWLEDTSLTRDGKVYRFRALKLNEVPIKASLANVPSAAQLMLLLERAMFLKSMGLQKRTIESWTEIARARIGTFRLEVDPEVDAINACNELLRRLNDQMVRLVES